MSNLNEQVGLKGLIQIFAKDTGKLLLEKDNIVIHAGREFILRRLFFTDSNSKFINLFQVGTGGAPASNPFSPIPPRPTDTELNNAIPFRYTTLDNDLTKIPGTFYPIKEITADNRLAYYYKRIDMSKSELVIDPETNKVFMHLKLDISNEDVTDENINELGLVISRSDFSEPQLFTKVSFKTEPFSDVKGLIVHYYVYA
jgi:hypothetical protein